LDHWREDQRLTIAQALHAVCVAPAWLSHDERTRGTLVPGRYADLVVLDRDPLACEPEELREAEGVATMLGGRWTHNPPPWAWAPRTGLAPEVRLPARRLPQHITAKYVRARVGPLSEGPDELAQTGRPGVRNFVEERGRIEAEPGRAVVVRSEAPHNVAR